MFLSDPPFVGPASPSVFSDYPDRDNHRHDGHLPVGRQLDAVVLARLDLFHMALGSSARLRLCVRNGHLPLGWQGCPSDKEINALLTIVGIADEIGLRDRRTRCPD